MVVRGKAGGILREPASGLVAGRAIFKYMSWFKSLFGPSRFDTLAAALATEMTRRYPPAMASGEGRRLSPQAVSNIVEAVVGKAVAKSHEWKLGVVGKARLGNAMRWALKERGYPDTFVDLIVEALIVYATRRSASAQPH
jgi:hypothetical protein